MQREFMKQSHGSLQDLINLGSKRSEDLDSDFIVTEETNRGG